MNSDDANFISGIHNWCDRWCERCAFTSRCRVFEREQQRDLKSPEDFWKALSENFKETLEMLHALAKEHGIEKDEIITEDKNDIASEDEATMLDEHPLSVITAQYLFKGEEWVESSKINSYLAGLGTQVNLGLLQVSEIGVHKAKIEEALEVIHWYLFFVHVRCKRVLHDLSDGFWKEYPEEEKSYNGSAKIAMKYAGMEDSV